MINGSNTEDKENLTHFGLTYSKERAILTTCNVTALKTKMFYQNCLMR